MATRERLRLVLVLGFLDHGGMPAANVVLLLVVHPWRLPAESVQSSVVDAR
jgi:hypothetical protein